MRLEGHDRATEERSIGLPSLWSADLHERATIKPTSVNQAHLTDAGILGHLELTDQYSNFDFVKSASKTIAAPVVAFDHLVQQQNDHLKSKLHDPAQAVGDITLGRSPRSLALGDAGEMSFSASATAIKAVDHIGQRMTPRAAVQDVRDSIGAVKTASKYYSQEAESGDWRAVAQDTKSMLDAMAQLLKDFNRQSSTERGAVLGEMATMAFFCARSRSALSEGELARRLDLTVQETRGLSEERLASHGITRIEPVNGRLPLNWSYAGQTMHFEGKLGERFPAGVQFDEHGFPDFSPYVKTLPGGRKAEVNIRYSGSYELDFATANKMVDLKYTPTGFRWHHHQNGKTLQLIPRVIHEAARHTGGCATSGLIYKR